MPTIWQPMTECDEVFPMAGIAYGRLVTECDYRSECFMISQVRYYARRMIEELNSTTTDVEDVVGQARRAGVCENFHDVHQKIMRVDTSDPEAFSTILLVDDIGHGRLVFKQCQDCYDPFPHGRVVLLRNGDIHAISGYFHSLEELFDLFVSKRPETGITVGSALAIYKQAAEAKPHLNISQLDVLRQFKKLNSGRRETFRKNHQAALGKVAWKELTNLRKKEGKLKSQNTTDQLAEIKKLLQKDKNRLCGGLFFYESEVEVANGG